MNFMLKLYQLKSTDEKFETSPIEASLRSINLFPWKMTLLHVNFEFIGLSFIWENEVYSIAALIYASRFQLFVWQTQSTLLSD